LRFAIGNNAAAAIVMGGIGVTSLYLAWRFAFRYQEELLKPVRGKQAAYQHLLLLDHGHVGIAITLLGALLSVVMAINLAWRFWTRLPAAIVMPDQLWLHPSFGLKPILFTNIVSVRLDRMRRGWFGSEVALIVETENAASRNWVFWMSLRSAYSVSVRDVVVDDSLFGLARFRDRLAECAAQARLSQRSAPAQSLGA
jgi:hypothetical protein